MRSPMTAAIRHLTLAILLGGIVAGCVAPAGAVMPSADPGSNPPVAPSANAPVGGGPTDGDTSPGGSGQDGGAGPGSAGGGSAGGGTDGTPGDGVVSSTPVPGSGGDAGGPVGGGGPTAQPAIVTPNPGRLGVHPVGATALDATLDGRRLVVKVSWWSGVAPCSVLDSVEVGRTGSAFALTVREGSDRLDVACIEIAMLKATLVDLGTLAPGTYVVTAFGDPAPIRVTIR